METLDDVIGLWLIQLKEHAMFIFKMLDGERAPNLKKEAYRQWQKWQKFTLNPNGARLPDMILEIINLKQRILDALNTGNEIGNIYPSLIEHMIKEANFFLGKLQNSVSVDQEIEFWVKENSEHTGLTAHLLDPSEKQLVIDSLNMSQDLEDVAGASLPEINQVYQQSNEAALELEESLKNNQVKTVNNPLSLLLLQHEIREATYGANRLQQIQ